MEVTHRFTTEMRCFAAKIGDPYNSCASIMIQVTRGFTAEMRRFASKIPHTDNHYGALYPGQQRKAIKVITDSCDVTEVKSIGNITSRLVSNNNRLDTAVTTTVHL